MYNFITHFISQNIPIKALAFLFYLIFNNVIFWSNTVAKHPTIQFLYTLCNLLIYFSTTCVIFRSIRVYISPDDFFLDFWTLWKSIFTWIIHRRKFSKPEFLILNCRWKRGLQRYFSANFGKFSEQLFYKDQFRWSSVRSLFHPSTFLQALSEIQTCGCWKKCNKRCRWRSLTFRTRKLQKALLMNKKITVKNFNILLLICLEMYFWK